MSSSDPRDDDEGPYGDDHTHEALHATRIVLDMFDSYVLDTRCAKEFADVRTFAQDVDAKLGELYTLIAGKLSKAQAIAEATERPSEPK